MTYEIIAKDVEETTALAIKLAGKLQPGDVLALEGDLGAGKTAFTKGIAKGLGITRNVNSPTFTIIKEYKGRLPLYHMDVYRMEDQEEDLGFDEYFTGGGVTIVEWAHLIKNQLPAELLLIHIYHHTNDSRRFVFSPAGERYEDLCKEIFK
ncbi:tRNA threonylcarbamoyladenosine biosynthesis protein TsaE [Peribacillus deserti]|uniref:tRNA threonylcarbamoyladenosine biosynthesis protein TsaE n=1 Tax=Peribacillus deserti TaxID=673318 RepID=A0ABS2QMT0_9BACI|nr:tRNA (adenosine(37)-N6)-threonylcarbamoyltransferase complex ATPase subunit type 1 TsaE [Peribacillus deserti]MBM7694471.1 tRNA threonylcarbamoyladenosine biosynthesis protein TsaE [Peribacillus deserti]